jgi:uncharacterized protein with FMN-binding domain
MSTGTGRTPPTELEQATARRLRARRAVAFAGMLTVIGGLVGVRATLTPSPQPALSSSGLAAAAGSNGAGRNGASRPAHSAAGATPARRTRVLVGKPYDVSYGIVQVKVTLHGTRIADVTALSLPRGGRSSDISQFAAPQLRREALSAQSAHIDTVSGASYTSAGYARSLQSALDQRAG